MEEIYRIGDRVTVLKDGSYVGTWALSEINTQQLIVKMVGRELHDVYPSKQRPVGKELLRVENLTTEKIKGVSFSLREGEVVGLAGLVGSGRTEVLRAIFAADKLRSGQVILEGKQLSMGAPIDAIRNGIGLLPEERKRQGIVNCLSVKDNITLIYSQLTAKFGFLKKAGDDAIVRRYIDTLHIKTPSAMQAVGNLSGGNQQKVVVSKWLSISLGSCFWMNRRRGSTSSKGRHLSADRSSCSGRHGRDCGFLRPDRDHQPQQSNRGHAGRSSHKNT